jgi:cation:H+ antiporter
MWYMFGKRGLFRRMVDGKVEKPFWSEIASNVKQLVNNTGLFLFSLALLFISAEFVVRYATNLSIDLALPPILIGLFLVAVGTSLPELVFGARAVMTKHEEMALGDIIGAVVVNSTIVLGVAALIFPLTTTHLMLFFTSAAFMLLVAFLFTTFVETESRITVKEGISLILLYAFFIFLEFYVKTITA